MRTYTTLQGDTWDLISYKVYGDEKLMDTLIKANPRHVNTVIFKSNVTLSIPQIQRVSTQIKPPWAR